jgi:hypothetical protein
MAFQVSEKDKIARVQRRLRIVRIFALFDLVLLVILVSAAITGKHEIVQIVGPLHGVNFLLLLVIVGVAALDGLWGWWFPLVILCTAGPPGALLGEWNIRRLLRIQNASTQNAGNLEHRPSDMAVHDTNMETSISDGSISDGRDGRRELL